MHYTLQLLLAISILLLVLQNTRLSGPIQRILYICLRKSSIVQLRSAPTNEKQQYSDPKTEVIYSIFNPLTTGYSSQVNKCPITYTAYSTPWATQISPLPKDKYNCTYIDVFLSSIIYNHYTHIKLPPQSSCVSIVS